MSFEQPMYSFDHANGQPPTPTKSPTSPSAYLFPSFETPRQESRTHDGKSPWSSAFANTFSPSFKTPNFVGFSPMSPVGSATMPGKDIEAEIASHEKSAQAAANTSDLARDTQSQDTFPLLDFSALQHTGGDSPAGAAATAASSIQTPPPTSSSTARRHHGQPDTKDISASTNGPAADADRSDHAQSKADESPFEFPHIQFSPDVFGFHSTTGPATAPVYPHQKLFWGSDNAASTENVDMSMDDTHANYASSSHKTLDPFVSDSHHNTMATFSTSPAFKLTDPKKSGPGSQHILASSPIDPPSASQPGPQNAKLKGSIVDPNMLFSSPSRANDVADMPTSLQAGPDDILQPYAHQIRDAQIERELERKRKKQHKRKRLAPEAGDSPAVKAAIEALREDRSDTSRSSPIRADSFTTTSSQDYKRRSPEHFHHRGNSHSSAKVGSRGKRPIVTLKIDSQGRAVAETVVDHASKPSGTALDVDESENSLSGSSSPDPERLPAFRSQHRTHNSQYLDDNPSHSRVVSDSSIFSSFAQAPRGLQMQIGADGMARAGALEHDENDSESDTMEDSEHEKGDAQTELRKMMRQRRSTRPTVSRITSAPLIPGAIAQHHPYFPTPRRNFHDPQNISPTTITDPDNVTPSTGRSQFSSESTRCVCSRTDAIGQLMIQCESCRKWLHTSCVGLNRHTLPQVYLCTFCTETPRAARQRRASRGLADRADFPPPTGSSPLAHKSMW